ncbi:MAG TPA: hypothetical protein VJM33_11910 [Microthrixaceae bacterium]|nr:hypothetical protein [Microthrixaceae bacterium]
MTERRRGRTRRGLDSTIGAWRASGSLEQADDAWLALARITADVLDEAALDPEESRFTIGALAGRHREKLAALDDRRHRAERDGPTLLELLAAVDAPTGDPAF